MVTVEINGDVEEEHYTTIKNNGKEIKFWTDGYDGATAEEILEILDFVGVEYFTIIKR